MWVLGYIFFGFYSVYRVLLFVDISKGKDLSHLACIGLMWGRLGDAAGAASGIMLSSRPMVLITVMALLFVICIFLFFHLYHTMYMHPVSPEVDYIQAFAARYDLSQREADIFRMVIGGCTNKEIADRLYISENTVKFHVRNLLRKTDCSKRKELLALYESTRSPERNYCLTPYIFQSLSTTISITSLPFNALANFSSVETVGLATPLSIFDMSD